MKDYRIDEEVVQIWNRVTRIVNESNKILDADKQQARIVVLYKFVETFAETVHATRREVIREALLDDRLTESVKTTLRLILDEIPTDILDKVI